MRHIIKSKTEKGIIVKHYLYQLDDVIIIYKFCLVPMKDRSDFLSFVICKTFKNYFLMVQIIAFKKSTFKIFNDIVNFPNINQKLIRL